MPIIESIIAYKIIICQMRLFLSVLSQFHSCQFISPQFMSHVHYYPDNPAETTTQWFSNILNQYTTLQFAILWKFCPRESAPMYTQCFWDFHLGRTGQLNSMESIPFLLPNMEYISFLLPNIIHIQCIKHSHIQ